MKVSKQNKNAYYIIQCSRLYINTDVFDIVGSVFLEITNGWAP